MDKLSRSVYHVLTILFFYFIFVVFYVISHKMHCASYIVAL